MVNYNSKAYQVAKYAIMLATISVAMLLDRVISLGLPTSTAAVVILVTFSFCFMENRWLTGVLACGFFGLASFFKEFIFPSSVAVFPVYAWPLITVLTRVACGAVAFGAYRLMLLTTAKMKNKYQRQTVSITIATLVGNITNTVLFLSALNIAKMTVGMEYTSLIVVIKAVIFTNIIPEYLISAILAPHVVLGVRKGLRLGIDGNNWKLARNNEINSVIVESKNDESINQDNNITNDEDKTL